MIDEVTRERLRSKGIVEQEPDMWVASGPERKVFKGDRLLVSNDPLLLEKIVDETSAVLASERQFQDWPARAAYRRAWRPQSHQDAR